MPTLNIRDAEAADTELILHFIRELATDVVQVSNGRLKRFSGNWDYFIEKAGGGDERAALTDDIT